MGRQAATLPAQAFLQQGACWLYVGSLHMGQGVRTCSHGGVLIKAALLVTWSQIGDSACARQPSHTPGRGQGGESSLLRLPAMCKGQLLASHACCAAQGIQDALHGSRQMPHNIFQELSSPLQ